MTEQEYIASIDHEDWVNAVKDRAYDEFERLWGCGNVASDALEEFNNDVYAAFVAQGIRAGQIDDPDKEDDDEEADRGGAADNG